MPRALPMATRKEIVRRRQEGQALVTIAAELQLAYSSVRQIARLYRSRGEDGLTPCYQNCARPAEPDHAAILQRACELKRLHPTWGAGLIRIELSKIFITHYIPSIRTLQYSFRAAGVNRPRRRRRPRQMVVPATRVHEVWQVDAVEKTKLADGHEASWLTVTDEMSGAILATEFSPPRAMATHHRHRGPGDVQACFRAVGAARTDPR
jgi:transposase InsO family protein